MGSLSVHSFYCHRISVSGLVSLSNKTPVFHPSSSHSNTLTLIVKYVWVCVCGTDRALIMFLLRLQNRNLYAALHTQKCSLKGFTWPLDGEAPHDSQHIKGCEKQFLRGCGKAKPAACCLTLVSWRPRSAIFHWSLPGTDGLAPCRPTLATVWWCAHR